MMISTNLQAKYDREDFEHSKASKRRKRVEFISFCLVAFIGTIAIMGAM
jgi:hypothetical protein